MNRVAMVVAALLFGAAAGGSIVYEAVPVREPTSCQQVRAITDDYLYAQAELVSAMGKRDVAPDFVARGKADKEVEAAVAKLEPLAVGYDDLFEACEASS